MSTITLRYYAAAQDAAGREEEEWVLEGETTLSALKEQLVDRYGSPMAQVLKGGSFLIDGKVRRDGGEIGGKLVDVLPPFAGG